MRATGRAEPAEGQADISSSPLAPRLPYRVELWPIESIAERANRQMPVVTSSGPWPGADWTKPIGEGRFLKSRKQLWMQLPDEIAQLINVNRLEEHQIGLIRNRLGQLWMAGHDDHASLR